jgi:hypothetical protein
MLLTAEIKESKVVGNTEPKDQRKDQGTKV